MDPRLNGADQAARLRQFAKTNTMSLAAQNGMRNLTSPLAPGSDAAIQAARISNSVSTLLGGPYSYAPVTGGTVPFTPMLSPYANANASGASASGASSTSSAGSNVDTGALALDLTQIALDIVGIFEPTPFADGSNAIISVFRGNWGDAGLSALGIIPYIGDAAKLGKLGGWAKTVANAVELAASSPRIANALAPALKKIKDAIDAIPQGALDSLPKSAREAIESMKTKLDDFFAAVSRRVEPPAVTINSNVGKTQIINGRAATIGDAPTIRTGADGRKTAVDVNGDEVTVRQPRTYDARTENADGSITYKKGNESVTYDADGFPVFNSKADVYLEPKHLNSASDADHFRAANEALGDALRNDPGLKAKWD